MAKAKVSKPAKAKVAAMTGDEGHINVGYFSDFEERVARSYGFAAAYEGLPRSANRYTGKKATAWDAGYDAALN